MPTFCKRNFFLSWLPKKLWARPIFSTKSSFFWHHWAHGTFSSKKHFPRHNLCMNSNRSGCAYNVHPKIVKWGGRQIYSDYFEFLPLKICGKISRFAVSAKITMAARMLGKIKKKFDATIYAWAAIVLGYAYKHPKTVKWDAPQSCISRFPILRLKHGKISRILIYYANCRGTVDIGDN